MKKNFIDHLDPKNSKTKTSTDELQKLFFSHPINDCINK